MRKQLISAVELVRFIIESVIGSSIAVMETESVVKMRKTDNPFHNRIVKRSRVRVLLNTIYKNAMTKMLRELGAIALNEEYVPQPRTWGERVGKSAIIEHKGNYYLEVRVIESLNSAYYLDGTKPIDKAEFEQFLPSRKPTLQESNGLFVRSYKLESIKEINLKNESYKIA